jgi:hypothetical protein
MMTLLLRRIKPESSICFALQFTTLKPVGDRILVKKDKAQEKTSGGILLPTTAQNKPTGGEVVALGGGRTLPNGKKIELEIAVSLMSTCPVSCCPDCPKACIGFQKLP